jgi:hypothetical protein
VAVGKFYIVGKRVSGLVMKVKGTHDQMTKKEKTYLLESFFPF